MQVLFQSLGGGYLYAGIVAPSQKLPCFQEDEAITVFHHLPQCLREVAEPLCQRYGRHACNHDHDGCYFEIPDAGFCPKIHFLSMTMTEMRSQLGLYLIAQHDPRAGFKQNTGTLRTGQIQGEDTAPIFVYRNNENMLGGGVD